MARTCDVLLFLVFVRCFFKVDHLSQILNNGTPVHVNVRSFLSRSDPDVVRVWEHEEVHERMPGTITKAHVPLDDASTLLEANIKYTASVLRIYMCMPYSC